LRSRSSHKESASCTASSSSRWSRPLFKGLADKRLLVECEMYFHAILRLGGCRPRVNGDQHGLPLPLSPESGYPPFTAPDQKDGSQQDCQKRDHPCCDDHGQPPSIPSAPFTD
jgi:hypothetical protein